MGLGDAYKTSAKVFAQVTRRSNPDLLAQLDAIKEGDINVVPGAHDHVEEILDALKIPYTMTGDNALERSIPGRVLFANCASYGGPGGASYDPETSYKKRPLQDFVQRGGRLVTTDWALGLVTKTFPNHLYKTKETSDDVVEIQCHTPLARRFIGMHYAECHPKWWLEESSHIYRINNSTVTPIITSDEMERKYGQPYVAAGFKEGAGEVLHFISHFVLQRTHQRSDSDRGGLESFLKKMNAKSSAGMIGGNVAELEAAYSTLNTVAHLCGTKPLLSDNTETKSVLKKTRR